jgi:hypothetical protein
MAVEAPRRSELPGPIFYSVALFQALGFHVPYFLLPEYPLRDLMRGKLRTSKENPHGN